MQRAIPTRPWKNKRVVNRFLGLDGYEWFVMLVGSALIALATWLM
jgi:hypothetical protein